MELLGKGKLEGQGTLRTFDLLRGELTDRIFEEGPTEEKTTEWTCPRMRRML